MTPKKGEKYWPRGLANGMARVEFIANLDFIRKRFTAGYSAAAVHRELLEAGKISMSERVFQLWVMKHFKLKKGENSPETAPPSPSRPEKLPLPPVPSGGVNGDKTIEMNKDEEHRLSRYEK